MSTCPNCEKEVRRSALRFEEEPSSRDYPGSLTHGCLFCLKGRYVYFYPDHLEALESDAAERRLQEAREA
jgi:hypothetical protein